MAIYQTPIKLEQDDMSWKWFDVEYEYIPARTYGSPEDCSEDYLCILSTEPKASPAEREELFVKLSDLCNGMF